MADRKNPVLILRSGLTDTIYAVTRYTRVSRGDGTYAITAATKHDVTADVMAIVDEVIAERQSDGGTRG